jgi:DNA-binding protein H-NS
MVTLDSIKLKIAKLEKQATAIAEKQSAIGLAKIRELMNKHGLSVADVETFLGKKRGRKALPKVANGAAKSARGNTKPVAPKYADPKSGATWSGRGRAPAWIKNAKDRSRFLIDGTQGEKATGAKAAAKKAPVKRAAAKKAGRKPMAAKKASAGARRSAATAKKVAVTRKVARKKGVAAASNTATAPAAV